jgi:hypothetical protein
MLGSTEGKEHVHCHQKETCARAAIKSGCEQLGLRDLLDFTVADAGCAHTDALSSTLHQRAHRL